MSWSPDMPGTARMLPLCGNSLQPGTRSFSGNRSGCPNCWPTTALAQTWRKIQPTFEKKDAVVYRLENKSNILNHLQSLPPEVAAVPDPYPSTGRRFNNICTTLCTRFCNLLWRVWPHPCPPTPTAVADEAPWCVYFKVPAWDVQIASK